MMKILDLKRKEVLPSEDELKVLAEKTKKITDLIEGRLKKLRISANVFLGGSFAKGTLIKKENYDVDLFVRFDKKYKSSEISKLLEKALRSKRVKKIHGSRDYFIIREGKIDFEIIPVMHITRPGQAQNVSDLSYFHVSYLKKELKKNKSLAGEIALAKTFCHAQRCYGAESYIKGFSGYALEVLVTYYKTFEKFLKEMVKQKEKLIIDSEKFYKNKKLILIDMNESKTQSPIVFIDPTYRERNVLAALSNETFEKFKDSARKFLKKPSAKYFEVVEINIDKLKDYAKKNKFEFLDLEIETNRQEGDIAGTKLLKFANFLGKKLEKYFEVKKFEFVYGEKKTAHVYFVLKSREKILVKGPSRNLQDHCKRFRKEHKKVYESGGRLVAVEKIGFSARSFINRYTKGNKSVTKSMSLTRIRIVSR